MDSYIGQLGCHCLVDLLLSDDLGELDTLSTINLWQPSLGRPPFVLLAIHLADESGLHNVRGMIHIQIVSHITSILAL